MAGPQQPSRRRPGAIFEGLERAGSDRADAAEAQTVELAKMAETDRPQPGRTTSGRAEAATMRTLRAVEGMSGLVKARAFHDDLGGDIEWVERLAELLAKCSAALATPGLVPPQLKRELAESSRDWVAGERPNPAPVQ
jgi:hypothetical protein